MFIFIVKRLNKLSRYTVFHLSSFASCGAVVSDSGSWHHLNAASRSHSDIPHTVGLRWTSDQPDTQTST